MERRSKNGVSLTASAVAFSAKVEQANGPSYFAKCSRRVEGSGLDPEPRTQNPNAPGLKHITWILNPLFNILPSANERDRQE
ncbi:MAG TPA: hypothetical protein DIW47_04465 [Bacteroidetes bacterium]|nr:hypothetical protein [Bacteroidota bacterium]